MCIFCDIVNKKIPAKIVHETETVLAFEDISPQAPIHFLIIPKKHLTNVLEFSEKDDTLLGQINRVCQHLVKEHHLNDTGFRLVTNTGEDGGQTVNHIHFHLLGGRKLTWPPG